MIELDISQLQATTAAIKSDNVTMNNELKSLKSRVDTNSSSIHTHTEVLGQLRIDLNAATTNTNNNANEIDALDSRVTTLEESVDNIVPSGRPGQYFKSTTSHPKGEWVQVAHPPADSNPVYVANGSSGSIELYLSITIVGTAYTRIYILVLDPVPNNTTTHEALVITTPAYCAIANLEVQWKDTFPFMVVINNIYEFYGTGDIKLNGSYYA